MMKLSIGVLIAVAILLAGCTKTNPDQKPVYFDYPLAGVPA